MPITQFFAGWNSLSRVAVVGACAYVMLVAMVRIAGKRSLAKMNAFDLVVTVALGSTLATILLSRDVPLLDGLVALGLLLALQASVSWSSAKWPAFARVVKSAPTVLYDAGSFDWKAMQSERVTREEVMAAVRGQALASLDDVAQVVIESNGELSVQPLSRGFSRQPGPSARDPAFRGDASKS